MASNNHLYIEGISFLPKSTTLGLHLVTNCQGKVRRLYQSIDRTTFERYMLHHFAFSAEEQIRGWINECIPTKNRWHYLNAKAMGCTFNAQLFRSYSTHNELIKDFFHPISQDVNRLRSAVGASSCD